MGVFSIATFRCKECGSRAVDFQSKVVEGEHWVDGDDDIPVAVLADIDDETAECRHCDRQHRLVFRPNVWVEALP